MLRSILALFYFMSLVSGFIPIRGFLLTFLVIKTLILTTVAAQSPENPRVTTPHATVSLISDHTTIVPGQRFTVGLNFILKPGWHIYYSNPGDSGLPPKAIFSRDSGAMFGEIEWPIPERIPFGPLVNYGYHNEVLLPIAVTIPKDYASQSLTLEAQVSWLVCEEDCIPEKGRLEIFLSTGEKAIPSQNVTKFAEHQRDFPSEQPSDFSFRLVNKDSQLVLNLPNSLSQGTDIYFFSEQKSLVKASAPQRVSKDGQGNSVLTLETATSFKGLPAFVSGILTYRQRQSGEERDDRKAIKIVAQGVGTQPEPEFTALTEVSTQDGSTTPLLILLLSALAGGVILNLMPCVLPVLSLKVLSLVNQAEDSRARQLLLALSYTIGIVSSLVTLGGLLLVLRDQGAKIGWGFQLQYAPVIGFLAIFFFVLGLSFLGFIEFGERLASKAATLDRKEGLGGAFLSGLLATIVATPCTAPFLGTAVGVALVRPWYQALLIFASMGVGVALPYILLVLIPQAKRFLPRPGAWMVTFKELLAFPLFATSLWLLWVLSVQRGGQGILLVLLATLVTVFGLWLYKCVKNTSTALHTILRAISLGIALTGCVGVMLPELLSMTRSEKTNQDGSISDVHGLTWIPYSEEIISQFRSQGKTIYLDFTAAWCITCQVNKNVVFSDRRIIDYVKNNGVILMRADWTNQDPEISKALERFGRGSVPFNLIYHGAANTPTELPTILTPSVVLEAFNR